jgi:hypothetical protein
MRAIPPRNMPSSRLAARTGLKRDASKLLVGKPEEIIT